MNSAGKFLTAVAAGVAAGAILGILYAPDKGSETRRKISSEGEKLTSGLRRRIHLGKEKINGIREGMAQGMKENIEDFA